MDDSLYTILPPGTVPLVEFQAATDNARIILSPTPSKNDPNDPLNWASWRKYLNYILILAMSVATFTCLQVQTVFWQQMSVDLDVTISQLNNAQSANLAGLAVGCAFFIPFTVKYGRRLVYILSTAVLAGSIWWMSRMESFAELIVTSVIAGLAGAINETAVQMTIADMFFVHQRARANACYFAAVMIGSFLTPIAAGSQAAHQGWRWSYYALAIAMSCLAVIFVFFYEETKYVPITLGQSEQAAAPGVLATPLEKEKLQDGTELNPVVSTVGDESIRPMNSYRQRMRLVTPTSEPLWKVFIMPLNVIVLPHVLFTALQFAAVICWLVLFMSIISVIFSEPPYNFTTAGIGYMSLGPFVGNTIGAFYGGPLSDWSVKRFAKRNGGLYEPEMRLYILPIPILCMAGGLIMFGMTAARGMHWILPSVGGAFFAFGMGSLGDITFTFTVDTYRELIAEAFVGVAFFRNAASVGIPFAMVPWLTRMGLSNMFIVIGCLSLAIGLLFIPMIIWGKQMRTALAPYYHSLVEKRARNE